MPSLCVCTLYSVLCTLHSALCTLYSVLCTLYSVFCASGSKSSTRERNHPLYPSSDICIGTRHYLRRNSSFLYSPPLLRFLYSSAMCFLSGKFGSHNNKPTESNPRSTDTIGPKRSGPYSVSLPFNSFWLLPFPINNNMMNCKLAENTQYNSQYSINIALYIQEPPFHPLPNHPSPKNQIIKLKEKGGKKIFSLSIHI